MALTGSMRDFGISEILQLIGHQKKSGTLLVKDKLRKVEILFDQGNIVAVKHEPPDPAYDPAQSLARAGRINRDQLEAAIKESARSLKPLPQLLLNQEAVSLPDLKAAVTLSHLEAIYSLFLWQDGDYSFEAGPVSYPHQWTEPISSEQVLMDGYRIKDEWPKIQKTIPDPLVTLEKKEIPSGVKLSPEHQNLLRLIDGQSTVEDIAFRSRLGRFETMKHLAELIDQGLVFISGAVEKEEPKDAKTLVLQGGALLVLGVGFLAVLLGIFQNGRRIFWPPKHDLAGQARKTITAVYQQDRVINALGLHAALFGSYPKSLQEMVEKKELRKKELKTPLGAFAYQLLEPDGSHCQLSLPSPTIREPDSSGKKQAGP